MTPELQRKELGSEVANAGGNVRRDGASRDGANASFLSSLQS